MGIELGKLFYWNASPSSPDRLFVKADRKKLRLLASLVTLFLVGGIAGANRLRLRGLNDGQKTSCELVRDNRSGKTSADQLSAT